MTKEQIKHVSRMTGITTFDGQISRSGNIPVQCQMMYKFVLFVAEWIKAPDFDASAGGESPVRAPMRVDTLCPYA